MLYSKFSYRTTKPSKHVQGYLKPAGKLKADWLTITKVLYIKKCYMNIIDGLL